MMFWTSLQLIGYIGLSDNSLINECLTLIKKLAAKSK